jgi:hypothetical protein
MTHDEELIERVKDEIRDVALLVDTEVHDIALAAITAVRAYDAERRASVLDVAALKTFDPASPGTLVWLPDGMPSIPTHDPDDYRDLPVAMTGHVRFEGGLTEKKRD